MSGAWRVSTCRALAVDLLADPLPPARAVRLCYPTDRAVVLGSTQSLRHVDAAAASAAGVAVLRRRSGGGAVLVGPGLVLWVDVSVPVGDRLWQPDVGRAFWWLGSVWADALAGAGVAGVTGVPGASVWQGPLVRTAWSDRICFAGLGPGEVQVGGAKVVGLAQRRTREAAFFHCAVLIQWEPAALVDLLSWAGATERARCLAEVAPAAAGVGAEVAERVVPTFLARLPED